VKARNDIPPEYDADVIYQRKLRIIVATPASGDIAVTSGQVCQAAGFSTATQFQEVMLLAADVYGPDSGAGGILVTPFVAHTGNAPTQQSFSDFGMTGAARSHVFVRVSPKDQQFVATSPVSTLLRVAGIASTGSIGVAVTCIVDLHLQFRGLASPLGRLLPLIAPADDEDSLADTARSPVYNVDDPEVTTTCGTLTTKNSPAMSRLFF